MGEREEGEEKGGEDVKRYSQLLWYGTYLKLAEGGEKTCPICFHLPILLAHTKLNGEPVYL